MTDRTAAEFTREIVLAQEPDFRLSGTGVCPSSLEVSFQGETTALEPRVMQVLVALHRKRGQAVSRQELVESCWAGRVVTEGALNRPIAQLRKALRDPGIRIDTVPTVGYRLNADTVAQWVPVGQAAPVGQVAPVGQAASVGQVASVDQGAPVGQVASVGQGASALVATAA